MYTRIPYIRMYICRYYDSVIIMIITESFWLAMTVKEKFILLSFSPIFLFSNSFCFYLICSIFCSKFQCCAQSLAVKINPLIVLLEYIDQILLNTIFYALNVLLEYLNLLEFCLVGKINIWEGLPDI